MVMTGLADVLSANRIAAAIVETRARLAAQPPDTIAGLTEVAAIDASLHFAFQEAQARAHASQRLTVEEAQTIYVALGEVGSRENGGWAEGTDLATKITVTQVMLELMRPS